MSPQRIQLSRKAGWRKPEGAVVVSRPGRFGNPFRVRGGTVYGPSWGRVLVTEIRPRKKSNNGGSK